MPRRNSPNRNERLRGRHPGGIDADKVMASLRRDRAGTTEVGAAMAEARRKNPEHGAR